MLAIIGCGNLNRSDDGVGVVVARRIAERLTRHPVEGVRAFDAGTGGMEVMFAARGCDALVVVDACRSGAEPGAVFRVPGSELELAHEPGLSLHDFRWDHALHAGRRIFKDAFPKVVDVWLVEAESLEFGLELTPRIAEAVEEVYRQVLERVAEYAVNRHTGEDAFTVRVSRGRLTVPAGTYARYFRDAAAVAVLRREGRILLLPLEDGYGGTLVKRKNLAGDRSVEISEFLRAEGLDEWSEETWLARWNPELGGLAFTPEPVKSKEGQRSHDAP